MLPSSFFQTRSCAQLLQFCSGQHFLVFLSLFQGQSTCNSLWQCDFTHKCKQVVNRLKIPQGLSTLLFHRWSEVPSRGGVHGNSPYEKLPALRRCHLPVFCECYFLDLLAGHSSIRTLLLSGCVVVFSILQGSVLLRVVFHRAPLQFDWFILGLFLFPSSIWLLLLVFLVCLAFDQAPLILNASFFFFFRHLVLSSCSFVLVSISQCFSHFFRDSVHVTACGSVISHKNVNRW